MHSTRREYRHRIDIASAQKITQTIVRGYVETGSYFVGPFGPFVANCDQFGACNMPASKQIGMAFGDAPTS